MTLQFTLQPVRPYDHSPPLPPNVLIIAVEALPRWANRTVLRLCKGSAERRVPAFRKAVI